MTTTLLIAANYEDFEEYVVLGVVKDKRRVPTLIKNNFKESLWKFAKNINYIHVGVKYKDEINICFDSENNFFHAKGKITDIEMKEKYRKLPKNMKSAFTLALMSPELDFEMFYRLKEIEEI